MLKNVTLRYDSFGVPHGESDDAIVRSTNDQPTTTNTTPSYGTCMHVKYINHIHVYI